MPAIDLEAPGLMNLDTVIGELVAFTLATFLAEVAELANDDRSHVAAEAVRRRVAGRLGLAVLATIDRPTSAIAPNCREDLRRVVELLRGVL